MKSRGQWAIGSMFAASLKNSGQWVDGFMYAVSLKYRGQWAVGLMFAASLKSRGHRTVGSMFAVHMSLGVIELLALCLLSVSGLGIIDTVGFMFAVSMRSGGNWAVFCQYEDWGSLILVALWYMLVACDLVATDTDHFMFAVSMRTRGLWAVDFMFAVIMRSWGHWYLLSTNGLYWSLFLAYVCCQLEVQSPLILLVSCLLLALGMEVTVTVEFMSAASMGL